jgi:hypothetical protein
MQIKYFFCNRISRILPLFASGIIVKYFLKSVESYLQKISNSSDSSNTHVSYVSEWSSVVNGRACVQYVAQCVVITWQHQPSQDTKPGVSNMRPAGRMRPFASTPAARTKNTVIWSFNGQNCSFYNLNWINVRRSQKNGPMLFFIQNNFLQLEIW